MKIIGGIIALLLIVFARATARTLDEILKND